MSLFPTSNSPSKGGTMRSQMPTSYQSPFGNQNYRTQTSPSKGGQPSFGGSAYQQPGQFGGQIMNRPMPSPGGKGGYQQPMMQQPMLSPGGKGGSYQRQPMPFGYGQSTFNPGQFGGYGVPSNAFSFNNPNYQPYTPPPVEPPPPPPYRGDDPRTSQPEVYDPNNLIVFNPYGEGGDLEGQPRPTFPDPTQPQGPQNLPEMFGFDFGGTPSGESANRSGLFNSESLTNAILQQQADGQIQQGQNNQEGLRKVFNRPLVPNQSPQQPVGIAGLMGRPGYGNQYPFR